QPPAGCGGVAPAAQAGDHVGAHPGGQLESGGGASGLLGPGDVGGVGGGDRGEGGVVLEPGGERGVEVGDLGVGHLAHAAERRDRGVDGGGGGGPLGGGDVQQLTGARDAEEGVARLPGGGQLLPHRDGPVTADEDQRAGLEP